MTECPYCGHRLRRRAPDLEREGDEIKVRETRRERRRREKERRRLDREMGDSRRLPSVGALELGSRPTATASVLLVSAILLIVQRAVPLSLAEAGAIVGPVGSDYWRYLVAPFVYQDIGALLVIGAVIAIFGVAVERRMGSVATLTLIIACGTGGLLAADLAATAGLDDFLIAAGGNGVALGLLACWLMLQRAEAKVMFTEPLDVIGVSTIAIVILLIPVFEVTADPIAGLTGGLLGLLLGHLAARRLVVDS